MSLSDIFFQTSREIQLFIQNYLLISCLVITPSSEGAQQFLKHKEQAQFILDEIITPYEALKQGSDELIGGYIKLGNEDSLMKKFHSNIQIKSEETMILERLIKAILYYFDLVKFIKTENQFFAIWNEQIFHFSNLLERANFNHIELSLDDLEQYHYLSVSDFFFQIPKISSLDNRPTLEDFAQLDPHNLCQHLTLSEKEAINLYTGSTYHSMNHLLRGKVDEAVEKLSPDCQLPQELKIDHCIKEILLHVAVAISGLNKLPDFHLSDMGCKYLYRAESSLPEETIKKRKWAVLTGGITTEKGFISTACQKPAESYFSEATQVSILIENCRGKDIRPLSQAGDLEREILLPPTQMQWKYFKVITTDTLQNKMTVFIATPVTVDPKQTLDYEPLDEEGWLIRDAF